ncbi:glycosyl transferase [Sphaerisporangium siamense]|uniref:Glycosyltransferase involved in cell wall biosynthesis n=1 Tax=Sphaerisporangium siamense TaxID=795645 RepID=A0A7W7DAP9_9ACTN|nr:glycosyltransferase family 4 protein [Sphaerisporangium siamense]MBB4703365.1 glycosyltransferase involved in cell wall biosynthesis [Sphaerisporangium siamense]GII87642.1 glycosyl transferase [Sphaerisporangium siamense]
MAETACRVLLVLGTSAGGVGRHVRMLAEGLAAAGHRVVVAGPASTDRAFGFSGVARFAEVPISDRPRPASDLRAVARLRALAAGADVVHAHGLRAGALAALAPGRRAGLVVTLHNALTASGAVGAVYGVLERVVARRADRVLVVSPDLGERMAALGARHVAPAVVPAPPLPPPGRTPAEVRAELGAGERPILLTVARLAQQKGLETLLDAARGPFEGEAPLFVVAGEGPLREPLQARIDAEGLPVRLLGDRADVADLLGAAASLVLASRWEGQPLIVQEALRAGRPVVATAVGGVPGMVGEAGLLVPPGDAGALRDAVRRLLAEPGLAARLAAAAPRRPLPGPEDAVRAVLDAYEDARR